MTTYESEEAAERRAAALRGIGIWPSVIRQANGRFRLSVDLPGGGARELARQVGVPEKPRTPR